MYKRQVSARDRFIQLNGVPFLIEVLGSGVAGSVDVLSNVFLILLCLLLDDAGVAHFGSLPAASKKALSLSLQENANFSESWVQCDGSNILLAALDGETFP